jgi:hypothetical protein
MAGTFKGNEMRQETEITQAELQQQYDRTALASLGIGFDRAMASGVFAPFLRNSVIATRRAAARRAQAGIYIHHNQAEAA